MAAHRIALITDSTCDIPEALLEEYDIRVVPLTVVWGRERLLDHVDIHPETFYSRIAEDRVHPTTSPPSPTDFVEAYALAREEGAEQIVVFTISSALSATYLAAREAKRSVNIPVYVVDSRGPSMSLGWQVLAAARVREAGGDARAMIAAANRARTRMALLLYLDSVEYLYRGGRIGGAARFVSHLFNIKLLLYIDHETGRFEGLERARSRERGIEALFRAFAERMDRTKPLRVAVLHGDALRDAGSLAWRVQRELAPEELILSITGPVLGVHTGPGAIALCGYSEG